MKKTELIALLGATLLSTQLSAFDMGSMLKTAAPIAVESLAPSVKDNALLSSLTSLGITPTQALGGSAAILNSAKTKMKPEQFSALTQQAPVLGDILGDGAVSSLLGTGSVSNQFQALGMDSSMISKFTPLILNYAKGFVSPEIASALSLALSL